MGVTQPDLLTSLANLKVTLGVTATANDALFELLIAELSVVIADSCNRTHFLTSNPGALLTDLYSGDNTPELILRQWPIQQPAFTGNLTQGSAVVTNLAPTSGLPDTSILFVGQPCIGLGIPQLVSPIPVNGQQGTVIASINSATQVTLSNPATLTGTAVPLFFDIAVAENDTGYWGSVPGSYSGLNQLVSGADYGLQRDLQGGSGSKSGLLYRLNGVWDGTYSRDSTNLSYYSTGGLGNIQVKALIGYTSLPADLEMACIRAIAKTLKSRQTGQMLQTESLGGYNYSLAARPPSPFGLLDGDVGAVLAKYRITPSASPSN